MRTLPMLLLLGCGGTSVDAPTTNTSTSTTTSAACADSWVDAVIDLDPDGPDTQIHAASAATDDGVWVAWNRPDSAGFFDVYIGHLLCDGTMDVGPIQVDDSDENEIEPALAVSGDDLLVTWQGDNGSGTPNLSLRWRHVDRDGTLGPVQQLVTAGNAWMAAVVATPTGFQVAGSRGGAAVFEVFTQEVGADGVAVGGPVNVGGDPGGGQLWPSVGATAGGAPIAVFEQDGAAYVADGGAPVALPGAGAAPMISAGGEWVAYSDGQGSLRLAEPGGAPIDVDVGPGTHFAPTVVAQDDGGSVLAWYSNQGGLNNQITVGRFDAAGVLGDTVELGAGDAPPYGMNLVEVDAGLFFLAWQTGDNPAYRSVGQFLAL